MLRGAALTFRPLGAIVLAIVLSATTADAQTATLHTFADRGTRVAYTRSGHGPLVVLLAGGPGFEPSYLDPVADALARDRTVIVFHQRGTGASRAAVSNRGQLTVHGAVADLEALRVALGGKPLVLVGHSWGAMLSMAYAVAHPAGVARLVLIDPGPPSRTSFARVDAEQDRRLTAADKQRLKAALAAHDDSAIVASTFPAAFAYRAHVRSLTATLPRRFVDAPVFETIGTDLVRTYDLRAGLRHLHVAVSIVAGAADAQRFAATEVAALVPLHHLVFIPNAGHYPWVEAPAQTFAALRAALTH